MSMENRAESLRLDAFAQEWASARVLHDCPQAKRVTKSIPSFLKLHQAPTIEASDESRPVSRDLHNVAESFERVTGHSMTLENDTNRDPDSGDDEFGTGPASLNLVVEPCQDASIGTSRLDVEDHAAAITELANELRQTRHALWQREAELAAGVPVVRKEKDAIHLADRLESVLQGGAQAVGCQAAALYMLNDETSELKLRAGWGLDRQLYLEPARPLRGAVADLEALIGHAVVLEDTTLLPNWHVPLDFSSAVCVPVSTPTTILGTLWMFGDTVRDYDENQSNLIEIVAGRIAADLEREMLLQHNAQTKSLDRKLQRACQWQQNRLPTVTPEIDKWQVAGWSSQRESLSDCFYHWHVLPNGQLSASLGQACGSSWEAALTSAALHSAVTAHANHPHGPIDMVQRVNETFWNSSTGGQFASLGYLLADTESSEIEIATAGDVGVLLLHDSTCEVLTQSCPWIGLCDDAEFIGLKKQLELGDALVVFSDTVRSAIAIDTPSEADEFAADEVVAKEIADLHGQSAKSLIEKLRLFVDSQSCARANVDRTILVLQRR